MSDDFDLQHYLDSGGSEGAPQFDLQSYLDSGGEQGKDTIQQKESSYLGDYWQNIKQAGAGVAKTISEHPGRSLATAIPATLESLASPVTKTLADAAAVVHSGLDKIPGSSSIGFDPNKTFAQRRAEYEKALTVEPETELGKSMTNAAGAILKPVGDVISLPGKGVESVARSWGMNPENAQSLGEQTNAVLNAAALGYGARKKDSTTEQPSATIPDDSLSAARTPGASVYHEQYDSPPIAGGVDKAAIPDRAAVLQRVGFENARNSALQGDAMAAGTDANVSKFDEPAGEAALAQFESEKNTLNNHAESIIRDVGGTIGTDEDALNTRGQIISTPFDRLREWFKQQSKNDYNTTKERFGDKPIGQMENTAALLKDPDFEENLLGKGQENVLNAVRKKFQRFQDINPNGFNVDTAETFRKSLNEMWTPQNSTTLEKIKSALDNDVVKNAGEDVFGPARQRVILKHQLLDNPDGVSSLFDYDPKTPINRSTAFENIPDKLTRLPAAQFNNVLDTLRNMPAEIQPDAQRAIGEIQAHLGNKLLDAGNKFKGAWNDRGVTATFKSNAAKFESAFEDNPEVLQKIQDLNAAGRILSADSSYKGAAAQAQQAVKRGLMTSAISKVGAPVGTALGGMVAGTPGAVGGAVIGEKISGRAAETLGERQALKAWQDRIRPLSEVLKTPKSTP